MKIFLKTALLLLLSSQFIFAQQKEMVLRSNSNQISIKEGNSTYRDQWTLSPKLRPDIFVANAFDKIQDIVFFSAIDTISFKVIRNKKYDFVIVNGSDSAFTQISTYATEIPTLKPKLIYKKTKNQDWQPDTLKFLLGKDNYIHIKGTVNGSDSLDFIFDTGAGTNVITSSLVNTKVNLKIDQSVNNKGADGVSTVEKSLKNTILLQDISLENAPLVLVDYKGFPFEAVLGWIVFDDKIVEIDYDKKLLIIHSQLPPLAIDYTKLDMKMISGIPYIKCKIVVGEKEADGWFDLDTGSDGTLSLSQKFATANQLNGVMDKLGKSTSRGSAGIAFTKQKVQLPKLKIGKYELYQIPIHINDADPKGMEHQENIGNKILKRFNSLIDFKNRAIYLKPNKLLYSEM